MAYSQKTFLRFFGQNWAKIQKKFFGNSLFKTYKKSNKSLKILPKILFF